jgi:hypothetical protein
MSQAVVSRSPSQALPSNGSRSITCSNVEGRSRLIFNENERVAQWVQERLPDFLGWNGHFVSIGYERRGMLCGGVVFTGYCRTNIVIATALEAPLTKRFMRAIYYYPFLQLGVPRVTALVDAKNLRSRALLEHDGYVEEGRMRKAAVNDDVIIYGLLRESCRWL